MRKVLVSILLTLGLVLGGCTAQDFSVVRPTATLETPVSKAQASVIEGAAIVAATDITLTQNYKDGIITKAQKDAYAVKTKQAQGYVHAADALAGTNPNAANAQLALAKAITTGIQQELAKLAAQQGAKQ